MIDEDGRPVRDSLVELWQANAAGRYAHSGVDQHAAPLDLNFTGAGRAITDSEGRYRFLSVKPGCISVAQPRERLAARAHPLLGLGPELPHAARHADVLSPAIRCSRLDPIYNSVPDPRGRERLISRFDLSLTEPEYALGYRFDIVVRGRHGNSNGSASLG